MFQFTSANSGYALRARIKLFSPKLGFVTVFADKKIDRTDGIKVLGEKFWIHIRKSGTESIIRVYVESETAEKSEQICKETIDKLLN